RLAAHAGRLLVLPACRYRAACRRWTADARPHRRRMALRGRPAGHHRVGCMGVRAGLLALDTAPGPVGGTCYPGSTARAAPARWPLPQDRLGHGGGAGAGVRRRIRARLRTARRDPFGDPVPAALDGVTA